MATETNSNGNSNLAALPMWAKVLAWVGAPVAGMAYLIVWMTTTFAQDLSAVKQDMQHHAQTSAVVSQQFQEFVGRQAIETESVKILLRRICYNTAKTEIQRQECFK